MHSKPTFDQKFKTFFFQSSMLYCVSSVTKKHQPNYVLIHYRKFGKIVIARALGMNLVRIYNMKLGNANQYTLIYFDISKSRSYSACVKIVLTEAFHHFLRIFFVTRSFNNKKSNAVVVSVKKMSKNKKRLTRLRANSTYQRHASDMVVLMGAFCHLFVFLYSFLLLHFPSPSFQSTTRQGDDTRSNNDRKINDEKFNWEISTYSRSLLYYT